MYSQSHDRIEEASLGYASQVPQQVFVTDKLPKTATGKIQRRHIVASFIKIDGRSGD